MNMPLYDVTNKDMWVNPRDASNYDVLQKALRELGGISFNKDCEIVRSALDDLVATGLANNKFIFTKAGFLVGHQSILPHVSVNHIWEDAEIVFSTHLLKGRALDQAGELQLKFVGGLVRMCIAERNETWLVYRRPSGMYNKYTGKEITISEYWVNDNYVFEGKQKHTVSDLAQKFKGCQA
jgi:hypothetical protein